MTSAPPLLPPESRIEKRRSPFDWKPYAHAMLWMLPALALFNFCAIIVHPRVEGVWEASGVETGNRAIHLMKDFSRSGWLCAKIALACFGTLMALAEVVLRGHPHLRRSGCHVLAFSTNFAALTMITCGAIVLCTVAPIVQEKLSVYRRAAALCGVFSATEDLATFGSTQLSLRAEMLDPTEAGDLDTLERYDLLDAAIVLVEKSQNPVIRHQILGQALILLSHETDEDREVMSMRLLTAAGTMRAATFETVEELAAWHKANHDEAGWQALPISVVR